MSVCSGCGEQQPEGARFCFSCGTSLAAPACATCGQELVPGARFCSSVRQPARQPRDADEGAGRSCRPGNQSRGADRPGPAGGRPPSDQRAVRRSGGVHRPLGVAGPGGGPRAAVSDYFDQCRQVIGRYGGTVEKFIGDAVMAVWGVPTAHEDDAERSVRAGPRAGQRGRGLGADLGVPGSPSGRHRHRRGGGHRRGARTGHGGRRRGQHRLRVQSVAPPGQVWVDETTRLLTSSAITYVDVGQPPAEGQGRPVPLWAARAVVAARGGAQRADGLEAPLVGRDRELRLVKELFHAARGVRAAPRSWSSTATRASASPGSGGSSRSTSTG